MKSSFSQQESRNFLKKKDLTNPDAAKSAETRKKLKKGAEVASDDIDMIIKM